MTAQVTGAAFLDDLTYTAAEARRDLLPDLSAVPDVALWPRIAAAAASGQTVEIRSGVLAAITDLVTELRVTLEYAWADYGNARWHAATGWSVGCEDIAGRIARLTLLVGACPWQKVSGSVHADGSYRALHAALGIDPMIDEDRLAAYLAEQ